MNIYRKNSYLFGLLLILIFVVFALLGARYQNTSTPSWVVIAILIFFLIAVYRTYQSRRQIKVDPFASFDAGPWWIDLLLDAGLVVLFWGSIWMALVLINGKFDSSVPEIATAEIISKAIKSGRFSSNKIHLRDGKTGQIYNLPVGNKVFEKAQVGENAQIIIHRGRFEWPWIEFLDLKDKF